MTESEDTIVLAADTQSGYGCGGADDCNDIRVVDLADPVVGAANVVAVAVHNPALADGEVLVAQDTPTAVEIPAEMSAGDIEIADADASVGFSLERPNDAGPVEAVVEGGAATFADALPGVDVVYEVLPNGVKETLVLESLAAGSVFRFPVRVPAGFGLAVVDDSVVVADSAGVVRFTSLPAFMDDSAGAHSDAVVMSLDGDTIVLTADEEWLSDPERVWPVLLDWNFESVFDEPVTVTSASLQVSVQSQVVGSTPLSVDVHNLTQWFGTHATWNNRTSTDAWTTAGGSYDPAVIASDPTVGAPGSGADVAVFDVTRLVGAQVEGNLTTITPPAPLGATSIVVDAISRPVTVTNGNGQITRYSYDAEDRVTRITYNNDTTCASTTTCTIFTYDRVGNLTSRVDDNNSLTSVCDTGGSTVYRYNWANELISIQEPGANCAATPFTGACTKIGYENVRCGAISDGDNVDEAVEGCEVVRVAGVERKLDRARNGGDHQVDGSGTACLSSGCDDCCVDASVCPGGIGVERQRSKGCFGAL